MDNDMQGGRSDTGTRGAAVAGRAVPRRRLLAATGGVLTFAAGCRLATQEEPAAAAPGAPGRLLFASGFEDGVRLVPRGFATARGAWQDIVGRDAETGFAWPARLWGGRSAVQLLTMGGAPEEVIANAIETVPGRNGVPTRALYLGVRRKPHEWTQSPLLLLPEREPEAFCVSIWARLPGDLGRVLGPGGWFAPFGEWKSAGDFRVITNIVVGRDGTPFWRMKWDTNANGDLPLRTYWEGENRSLRVPQGEWMNVEFFTRRDQEAGRVWLKVDGRTVFDRTAPNIGERGARIDRIFVANAYASAPIGLHVDELQVWDGAPAPAAG